VVDHLIEVVMLDLQFMQGGAVFGNLFFGQHGRNQGPATAGRLAWRRPTQKTVDRWAIW
jgi:hypothetical protein